MRLSWATRQVIAILLLAVILVLVSGFLELVGAVRQAARQANVEADLVAGNVRRQLTEVAAERGLRSAAEVAADPRVGRVLMDALGQAPSVLSASVLSPHGIVAAHTQSARVGGIEPRFPNLTEIRTLREAMQTLRDLRLGHATYQRELPLLVDDRPFATVRIVIGGAFLWDAVRAAVSRGLWTALVVIGCAIGAGLLLGHFAAGRLRDLERGINALSDGKYEELPESGVDEFARLARALNLLGTRLAEGSPGLSGADGSAPAIAAADRLLLDGQTRAFQRLGEIAAGLAHELRNQLQAVELNVAALRNPREKDPETVRMHAENATRCLRSLNEAVRGFLKIARLRPPTPQSIRIPELLEETRRSFTLQAAQVGAAIELDLAPDLPETHADPEMLRQALGNLVRNALHAIAGREGARVRLGAEADDRFTRITVHDNGPGIPPEVQEKIFELFYTTQSDGTGVGLTLVRQSVEMHGGSVRLESDAERGTEVVIELPRGEGH